MLAAAPPQVCTEQARAVAAQHFGLHGTCRLLSGERDLNFQLTCSDGTQYVLKVSNAAEDPRVIDFQNQALLHIQQCDPLLPVQRIYPNLGGTYQLPVLFDGQPLLVRLLSFVDGVSLNQIAQPSAALRSSLGEHLGRLGLALRGFFHPGAGHELLWDLKHASRLDEVIALIEAPEQRQLARRFLDNFQRNALPRLKGLRAQVIHNDLNPHNVIVDAQQPHPVRNILDFGDMVHAPLVNDLAVGAAYQLGNEGDPLQHAAPFIAAYHRVAPLEPVEQELLFDLIATRLVLTVTITNWRAALYPENRAYILRNAPSAWRGLQALADLPREAAQQQIRRICSQETL
nr:phosphotransferase [Pseudomonas aegrilactucae]